MKAKPAKIIRSPFFLAVLLILLVTIVWLVSASSTIPFIHSSDYLDEIRQQGELRVITRNAPTTYYEGRNGTEGMEFDLINAFAKQLGVTPRFIVKDNVNAILTALSLGEGHIAAAGLSYTQIREDQFLYSSEFQKVTQQVVCRRGEVMPGNVSELENVELWVAATTSYVENLRLLRERQPTLSWRETSDFDTEQLLERVWRKEIDCTVSDSNIFAISRRYHPELEVAFDIADSESLVWLFPPDADGLRHEVVTWQDTDETRSYLDELLERYYGHVELFDYVDIARFKRRVKKRLPRYQKIFMDAASKHDLLWTLLAAQSYQESHWRRKAKSPTGVRGMMMLTLPTAREMGVKSRLNAQQSIFGGAKYLSQLRKRIPESVQEPDRTWYALAAYNVGMGHVYDARTLASRMGKNPDKWSDLSEVLPLLSQKKYYSTLKYGYARGSEPVTYVNRIRDFQDLLENILQKK